MSELQRPYDAPPTLREMRDVWAKVTRHHEIRTGETMEGKRDVFVMDTAIRWLDTIAMFPDAFKKWAASKINPPKFGRR
jgi:hypothetical protein